MTDIITDFSDIKARLLNGFREPEPKREVIHHVIGVGSGTGSLGCADCEERTMELRAETGKLMASYGGVRL